MEAIIELNKQRSIILISPIQILQIRSNITNTFKYYKYFLKQVVGMNDVSKTRSFLSCKCNNAEYYSCLN